MQKSTPLTLILTFLLPFFAHSQDTTWFNPSWKVSKAEDAMYYRTKLKTDSGWRITDHYLNGKPQMTGLYADDSLHIRQGTFRWYLDGGTIYQLSTYKADTLNGLDITYYLSGREKFKGLNKGEQRVGHWTVYFPSGKLGGQAVYPIVIRFGLSKEGKVSFLKVTQSADKYLDAEALRVLNLMPDWYPAVVVGVPVKSFHIQPIVFSNPGQ